MALTGSRLQPQRKRLSTASPFHLGSMSLETTWLPKLPVPNLEQTMEQYLHAVKMAVDQDQYQVTSKLVEEFLSPKGCGHKLQEILVEKQQKEDNWAYDWWLNDMYMNNPLSLPINSNPGMVFPRMEEVRDLPSFLTNVAHFISGILDYKELIDRQLLTQDRAASREKGQPLCMSQYKRLFTSYRVPGEESDYLKSVTADCSGLNEHIVVAHKGQFWRLDVVNKGQRMPAEELAFNLNAIIEDGQKLDPFNDTVGILTAADRRKWAQLRQTLLRDLTNAKSLQQIESCTMIICLDEPLPASLNYCFPEMGFCEANERDDTNRALQMLHGGGCLHNSANRWFDKTIQFIFSPDGVRGLCYEHSPAEGIVVVQMIETVLKNMEANINTNNTPDNSKSPTPKKLNWKIDHDMREEIKLIGANLDRLIEDLDFAVFRFKDYGKNFIKTAKISPDVYVQLALQLAHYKIHKKLVPTYESASTRRFLLGRVDCIRSATSAALEWVESMEDKQADDPTQLHLLRKAVEFQTNVMINNILGQGLDIHLLGLREVAKATENQKALQLFLDPSYAAINHFALSTSQIPTTSDSFMGYGPVVPDGYGASYNPQETSIIFCISSFHSCEEKNTRSFIASLSASLQEMKKLLENNDLKTY